MNTRIKELADQAKDEVPKGILSPDLWIEQYNQKFAELIVRDCISIARLQRNNMQFLASNPPQSAAAYDIERNIMNHFGVE